MLVFLLPTLHHSAAEVHFQIWPKVGKVLKIHSHTFPYFDSSSQLLTFVNSPQQTKCSCLFCILQSLQLLSAGGLGYWGFTQPNKNWNSHCFLCKVFSSIILSYIPEGIILQIIGEEKGFDKRSRIQLLILHLQCMMQLMLERKENLCFFLFEINWLFLLEKVALLLRASVYLGTYYQTLVQKFFKNSIFLQKIGVVIIKILTQLFQQITLFIIFGY